MKEFAIIEFKCKKCNKNNIVSVMEKNTKDKYNYKCECGARYWMNRTKGIVRYVG